jgi:hypothetical protein
MADAPRVMVVFFISLRERNARWVRFEYFGYTSRQRREWRILWGILYTRLETSKR